MKRYLLLLMLIMPVVAQAQFMHERVHDEFSDEYTDVAVSVDINDQNTKIAVVCYPDSGPHVLLFLGPYFIGDSDNDIKARYRWDDGSISKDWFWREMGNHLWMAVYSEHPKVLLQNMRRHSKLMVEWVDPADGERKVSTFSLSGFWRSVSQFTQCPS